ncbi:glycosyltransferase family 4 protein [Mycolicibacterium duvalii]|uniref:glycosyltransferase family 4 protein n=1 Tax=Mycolicibacterium duvalii TaxID=39688 RepID=UPI0021F33BEA|nr:glycosyltransferase family 4 protein [Mycolicibacterium duvalii]
MGDLSDRTYDLATMADALTRRGHDVQVYSADGTDRQARDARYVPVPVPVHTIDDRRPEALLPLVGEMSRFLLDAWQSDRPDVVHCTGRAYGLAAQLAAKKAPVATVQGFHGLSTTAARYARPAGAPNDAAKIEALLAKNATMVTTTCTDDKLEVIRMGCPRARVAVLPAGVDVDEVGAATPPATPSPSRHRVVSLTHNLAEHCGVDELITVMPSLTTAELTIATMQPADPRDLDRVHRMVRRAGVGARVGVLAAPTEHELCELLRTADTAVCPSAYDPHATLALRAMASGVAVVAVEAGGPRDAIVADVTGLLVPPGNTRALGRAVHSVLHRSVLRQGMGLAGRARIRSRYCWDRIATDAEIVYQAAVEGVDAALAR